MNPDQNALPTRYSRVYRPLGVSLAILATAVMYGLMPLGEIYFLQRINATAADTYLLGGVEIDTWTIMQGVYGGLILLACMLAWWGRPRQIRFVLIGLLLLITPVNLYRIVEAWTSSIDPIFGGQGQEADRVFLLCQFPAMLLLPPYVIWYLNRAPARAFYRRIPLSTLRSTTPPEALATNSSSSSEES